MTVIAWDGKSMAADRQGEFYCTKAFRTKIRRVGDSLVGCSGEARSSEAVCKWLEDGADHDRFPGLLLYENSPHPLSLENHFFAMGSGGDAAMAAMYLGRDAQEAVAVACEVCTGCGGGIDVLELEAPRLAAVEAA